MYLSLPLNRYRHFKSSKVQSLILPKNIHDIENETLQLDNQFKIIPRGKNKETLQLQYFSIYLCRHSLIQFICKYFKPGKVIADFDSSS